MIEHTCVLIKNRTIDSTRALNLVCNFLFNNVINYVERTPYRPKKYFKSIFGRWVI